MTPWPHQTSAVSETLAAHAAGARRVLVTTPTGGGKTLVIRLLAEHFLDGGDAVSLYTNRKLLIEQLSGTLALAGVPHGVRAAGYEDERHLPFQVSSIQTEYSRVLKRRTWDLHPAGLVLIDEAHLHGGKSAQEIARRHLGHGAFVVGFTATPVGLGECYDVLIQAGNTSELRDCGALVPARHYGPDEPDMAQFKKLREGEDLTEKQNRKAMVTPTLWGRVWEWFVRLNPDHRPTILFAPGVQESIWFAEQFRKRGVAAAHLDGKDVWVDGALESTTPELREQILDASRAGDVTVLCNRFVLREGIDLPHLEHGVFACVFGSLQSYLQAGGRLLRSHPGVESVTVQDHGGNWWRHGSLNADREWRLEMTDGMAYGLRADRLRAKQEREPSRCPRCAKILSGRYCDPRWGGCGHETSGKQPRPVVQSDGTLKEMTGDVFRPRRVSQSPDGPKLWEKMYHRSRTKKGDRTFRAAAALFAQENGWRWPDPAWPMMPTEPLDWYRHVPEVPPERLTR